MQSGDAPLVENVEQSVASLPKTKSGKVKTPNTTDPKVLWDHFQEHPDFFQAILIDKEAGFDEIGELWSMSRIVIGAAGILGFFINLYTIASFNYRLISRYWIGDETEPEVFLLSGQLITALGVNIPKVVVIALLEILIVLIYYAWGVLNFAAILNPLNTPCKRWHSVSTFFLVCFPKLATVGMVKLLNGITVQVFVPTLMWNIQKLKYSTTGSCELVWFLLTTIANFLLGFDAFLYKFQLIGLELTEQQADGYANTTDLLITVLFFVNQMLGIVQLGVFTKERIFIFIFAGEDGQMSEKEDAIKRTWQAMFCWQTYVVHGMKAFFIWLSFSDADFQKMVLDTKETAEDENGAQAAGTGDGANVFGRLVASLG